MMRTASNSLAGDATHLISAISSEPRTPGLTAYAAEAEAVALGAIRELADKLVERTAAVGGSEWTRARDAIERWISAASSARV